MTSPSLPPRPSLRTIGVLEVFHRECAVQGDWQHNVSGRGSLQHSVICGHFSVLRCDEAIRLNVLILKCSNGSQVNPVNLELYGPPSSLFLVHTSTDNVSRIVQNTWPTMAAYSTVNRHRLLSILVLTFFLVLFSLRDRISTSTIVSSVWKPSISSHHRPDQACSDGVEDILVIMKTGATEAYEKLPIHFVTTLKCFTNESLLLISDMEMDMGDNHHLIDILKDFPEILRKSNDDFALYDKLGHFNKLHQDSRKLENNGNGWKLDKYKFIPMLLQAWEHGSERGFKWYLFIEADSGIIWDNLRTYLNRLDSKEKHYIGSPTLSDIAFAHGGTGYVISRGAMEEAIGNHPEIGDRYNQDVQAHCCGVRFVARVLLDQGIAVTHAWPLFQGERPTTIPFTEQQWCQPVISMHHLTPEEVSQVWVFEQERKAKGIKVRLGRDSSRQS
jgi:hypothetical protein